MRIKNEKLKKVKEQEILDSENTQTTNSTRHKKNQHMITKKNQQNQRNEKIMKNKHQNIIALDLLQNVIID